MVRVHSREIVGSMPVLPRTDGDRSSTTRRQEEEAAKSPSLCILWRVRQSVRTVSATETYEGQDLEALADIPNYQRWILDAFPLATGGRVLEIGAGIGNLARHYVDRVDETVLLEPASNLQGRLEAAFRGRSNVHVVSALLDEVVGKRAGGASFELASFDTILLINVLEHVKDDLAMLRHVRSLLRPGGSLLLFVPALPWLYGSLDALAGHERRYTREGLRAVVASAQLEIRFVRYFDVLGVLPWFVAGRVLKRTRFDESAAKLWDRSAVPVGARMERYIAPPLGKNLICVAGAGGTEPSSTTTSSVLSHD
jgi:SAM-dependent methyltransferase